MKIEFLGTGCMVPTKERNHSAIVLFHESDSILIDCGEGTQKQMKIAKIDMNRISKILISHWHGDHVLGLGGFLQTLASQNYSKTLKIFGPKGSKEYFSHIMKGFSFDNRIDVEVSEISKGVFLDSEEYYLEVTQLNHSTPCLGFSFIEKDRRKMKTTVLEKLGIPEGPAWGKLQKGKDVEVKGEKILAKDVTTIVKGRKVTYIADTEPCKNAVDLAQEADILISESTLKSEKEERAEETKHMTAVQAATLASQANVKKLVLTHFSQRYTDVSELEDEAKIIFPNTVAARDFMKIKL